MKNLENPRQESQAFVKAQKVIGGKITVLETANYQSFQAACDYVIEKQLVNYLVINAPTLGRCILSTPKRNCSFFSFYEESESFAKLLDDYDSPVATANSIWQTHFLLGKDLDDFLEIITDQLNNNKLFIH